MSVTASASATKWINAWAVSYLPTMFNGVLRQSHSFNNETFRLNLFPKLSGTQARVKFTNKFTAMPLIIGAAHVASRAYGANIDPATDRALKFGGKSNLTIGPGEEAWSDPVTMQVKQHADIVISTFIPTLYRPTGFHPNGTKTSYIGPGNQAGEMTISAAPSDATAGPVPWEWRPRRGEGRSTDHVYLVSDLQVMAPISTKVIIAFGDSITDGAFSAVDANGSWPDHLSKRLPKLANGAPVAVINMGLGSNRFASGDQAGPAGIKRFEDDVLGRPNVSHVIIMHGITDISYEQIAPETLITAYKVTIARAHAKGIKVFMATLLPIQNSRKDTPANIATQQLVNSWIRRGEGFEGVLDFDQVMRDPQNPLRFRANLTGDYVHPTPEGYKLLADSIDLNIFE